MPLPGRLLLLDEATPMSPAGPGTNVPADDASPGPPRNVWSSLAVRTAADMLTLITLIVKMSLAAWRAPWLTK
jgi:hypothetical protein